MNTIKNICVLGDSIMKGIAFDKAKQKYYTVSTTALDILSQDTSLNVKNLSKFGCTTEKALKNLGCKLKKDFKADAVIIELGGNDCDHLWDEISQNPNGVHHAKIKIEDFCRNLKNIIKMLNKHRIKAILMNLPPIDSERYFNWISAPAGVDSTNVMAWLKDKNVIYRNQERYSSAICKIALECSVQLIDIRNEFLSLKNLNDYLCIDGIHLNEKGQQILGNSLVEYFKENKDFNPTTLLGNFSRVHSHSHSAS